MGGYWELSSVQYLMDCLKEDERLEFIDIGANIGAYTLAVAHMKRRVVAVEPNQETLRRLSRSIYLGNVSEYVTLVSNAVSDRHTTVRMRQDPMNRGDASILDVNNCLEVGTFYLLYDDLSF